MSDPTPEADMPGLEAAIAAIEKKLAPRDMGQVIADVAKRFERKLEANSKAEGNTQ